MILSFHIEYRTNWGEDLRISGNTPELGQDQADKSILLHTVDGIHWSADIEVQAPENETIEYCYQVFHADKIIRTEWNDIPRRLYTGSKAKKKVYRLLDCWRNLPEQLFFYSSAFTDSLLAHSHKTEKAETFKKGFLIKAFAPNIDDNHCLAISGNQEVLGDWDITKAVVMITVF